MAKSKKPSEAESTKAEPTALELLHAEMKVWDDYKERQGVKPGDPSPWDNITNAIQAKIDELE